MFHQNFCKLFCTLLNKKNIYTYMIFRNWYFSSQSLNEKCPSLICIITENEKANLKTVIVATFFPSPSIHGVVRARIHGWHTFAAEWHVREPFAGVSEGRRDPPFAPRAATEEGNSPRVNTRNHGDRAGVLYLYIPDISSSRDKRFRRVTTSRPRKGSHCCPKTP